MATRSRSPLRKVVTLLLLAALGTGGYLAFRSEPVQRALGRREQFRIEPQSARPQYASATIELTEDFFSPESSSVVRVAVTSQVDRASLRASSVTDISAYLRDSGGRDTPFDLGANTPAQSTMIYTSDATYLSGATAADPWARTDTGPYYYPGLLSEYYVPTYDDVVGFEVAGWPAVDALIGDTGGAPIAGVQAKSLPPDVVRAMTYTTTNSAFNVAAPILHRMSDLEAAPDDKVTFTIGFDAQGLMRYFDASIEQSAATTVAQKGDGSALISFIWRVTGTSPSPVVIEPPTNFVAA